MKYASYQRPFGLMHTVTKGGLVEGWVEFHDGTTEHIGLLTDAVTDELEATPAARTYPLT